MGDASFFRRLLGALFIVSAVLLAGCASTPGREEPLAMIVSTAFSPDGKLIAVSTNEGEIALFDFQPLWFRRLLSRASDKVPMPRAYEEMIDSVYRPLPIAFSPDGRFLAAGGVGASVVVWEIISGDERFRLPVKERVLDLAFFPDGQRLVIAGPDAAVVAVGNGEKVAALALPMGAKATAGTVSPDGRAIIIGLSSGEIALFDGITFALTHQFKAHELAVSGVAFAPDGRLLASTAGGYDLRLWQRNAKTGFEKADLPFAAAASADESVAQAKGLGTMLWLLGTARGFQLVGAPTLGAPPNMSAADAMFANAARTIPFHCASRVSFSADGRYLASTANLIPCRACIGRLSPAFLMFLTDLKSGVTNTVRDTGCEAAFAPNGEVVATGGPGIPLFRASATGQRWPK